MREIKFRGMSVDLKKWIYGYLFVTEKSNPTKEKTAWIFNEYGKYKVKPETVGQFIGITTKDDKLFCGDIIVSLDSGGNEIKHIISYDDHGACFVAQFVPYNQINPHCGINQKWVTEFDKKKIGNIHEHKK